MAADRTWWRRAALVVAPLGFAVTVVFGVLYHGDRHASALDRWLGAPRGKAPAVPACLLLVTNPYVLGAAVVVIAATAWLTRRRLLSVLAVVAPVLAVSLTELVLKPVFDRHHGHYLCFPSGHTVALVSVLTVALLLVPRSPRRLLPAGALWLLLLVAGGAGLVGRGYHYPTDVAGGVAFSVAVVLLLALGGSRLASRASTRRYFSRYPPRERLPAER